MFARRNFAYISFFQIQERGLVVPFHVKRDKEILSGSLHLTFDEPADKAFSKYYQKIAAKRLDTEALATQMISECFSKENFQEGGKAPSSLKTGFHDLGLKIDGIMLRSAFAPPIPQCGSKHSDFEGKNGAERSVCDSGKANEFEGKESCVLQDSSTPNVNISQQVKQLEEENEILTFAIACNSFAVFLLALFTISP